MKQFRIISCVFSFLLIFTACKKDSDAVKEPEISETWQEHWFEHNQLLNSVFSNDDLIVFYDKDVNKSVTWPNEYLTKVWQYTKTVYGGFGSNKKLYAIFHTGKYGGGHPSNYFEASHDNRNVIDVGLVDPKAWEGFTANEKDIVTHEVGHIVEFASKGKHNSPAFKIWGDSKWMEIYQYDVYKNLGMTSDAERWYNKCMATVDNFPKANTQWFKNWFYPIYSKNGGTAALNKFFVLLSENFPSNGTDYSRDMNFGEFVHFWSGAAGVNLKAQATIAFGWTTDMENQFNKARTDFPNVKY
ncbi:hypothetical protein [Pedobacter mendelii]|uniref:Substrate import-associated zinc metallohydrolase lipoprotein n=1 Tax=Pedobacter mendelii TaxID=1908240 RepID=A0ABQ2BK88_9SPHI|nr:hypothetical protein [Pedobacter mendelii]GGI28123.1 hypothetical protein GCM10008119_31070 [Pedobacter mendelii]